MKKFLLFILLMVSYTVYGQVKPQQLDPCEDANGDPIPGCIIISGPDGGYIETLFCEVECPPAPIMEFGRFGMVILDNYNCEDPSLVMYKGVVNDGTSDIFTVTDVSSDSVEDELNDFIDGLINGTSCIDDCLIENQLFEWDVTSLVSIEKIFDDGVTFQFIYEFPNSSEKFKFYDFYNYAKQTDSRIVDHNGINFHGGILESLDPISPTGAALTINTTNPVPEVLDEGCEEPFNGYVADVLTLRDSLVNSPPIQFALGGVDSTAQVWSGYDFSFSRPQGVDCFDPLYIDKVIIGAVHLAKGATGPLFNEALGDFTNPDCLFGSVFWDDVGCIYDFQSPIAICYPNCPVPCYPYDTEWAVGETINGDYETLTYYQLIELHESLGWDWNNTVGTNLILHIISTDQYIDFRFTSWFGNGVSGTEASWVRANPPISPQIDLPVSFDVTTYTNQQATACEGCYEHILSATDCDGLNMAPYDTINLSIIPVDCYSSDCTLPQPCPEIFPFDVYSPYDESLLGTANDINELIDFLNNDPLSEFDFFSLDECTLGHNEICEAPLKSFGDIPTSPVGGSLDNQPEVCAPLFGSEQIITGTELIGLTDGSIEIKYGYSADNIIWVDSPYVPWTGAETQYDFGSPVLQEGYYIRTCSRVTGNPLTEICDVKRLPELSITGSYNESNCSIQVVIENIAPDSSNENWQIEFFHYAKDGTSPVCAAPSDIIEDYGGFLSLGCWEIYAPDEHTFIYNFFDCYDTIEDNGQVIFGNIYLEVEYESNDLNCYPYLYTDVIDEFRIDLPVECGTDGAPNINISGDPFGFTLTSDLTCVETECVKFSFDICNPSFGNQCQPTYVEYNGVSIGCDPSCPPCSPSPLANICSCIFFPTYYACGATYLDITNEALTLTAFEAWYDYLGIDYSQVIWEDVTVDPLEPMYCVIVGGTTDTNWRLNTNKPPFPPDVIPTLFNCEDLANPIFTQPPAHWVIVNDGTTDVFQTAQGDIGDVETELNNWWTTTAMSGTTYSITIYSTFCDGTGTFVGNTIEVTAP